MPVPFGDSLLGDESAPTSEEQLTVWGMTENTCLDNTGTTLGAHLCVVMILTSLFDIWAMCPEEDGTRQGVPVFFLLHVIF